MIIKTFLKIGNYKIVNFIILSSVILNAADLSLVPKSLGGTANDIDSLNSGIFYLHAQVPGKPIPKSILQGNMDNKTFYGLIKQYGEAAKADITSNGKVVTYVANNGTNEEKQQLVALKVNPTMNCSYVAVVKYKMCNAASSDTDCYQKTDNAFTNLSTCTANISIGVTLNPGFINDSAPTGNFSATPISTIPSEISIEGRAKLSYAQNTSIMSNCSTILLSKIKYCNLASTDTDCFVKNNSYFSNISTCTTNNITGIELTPGQINNKSTGGNILSTTIPAENNTNGYKLNYYQNTSHY